MNLVVPHFLVSTSNHESCGNEIRKKKNETLKQHTSKCVKAAPPNQVRDRCGGIESVARPLGLTWAIAGASNHASDALEVARVALACILEEKEALSSTSLTCFDSATCLASTAMAVLMSRPLNSRSSPRTFMRIAVNIFPAVSHRLSRPELQLLVHRPRPSGYGEVI